MAQSLQRSLFRATSIIINCARTCINQQGRVPQPLHPRLLVGRVARGNAYHQDVTLRVTPVGGPRILAEEGEHVEFRDKTCRQEASGNVTLGPRQIGEWQKG
jgi:hypothetical protein